MEDMSPIDTVRTADSILDDEEEVVEKPTRAELLELVEQMQHDWATLNEYMNRTAAYYSWCGDYEERQQQYNRDFKVLKLQPRSNRDNSRRREVGDYLLPSLRRRMAQDNLPDSLHREQEIAQKEELFANIQLREQELRERESRLRERERAFMSNVERRSRTVDSEASVFRARLEEPRPAFRLLPNQRGEYRDGGFIDDELEPPRGRIIEEPEW
jgi:hypothetical protein